MRAKIHPAFIKSVLCGLALIVALFAVPASAATYSIDATHSSAIFKVKHFGVANFYGMFGEVSGTIEHDAASAEGLAVEVTIAAASVDTRADGRDNHLKSPDFLNAAEFPTITFKSTGVADNGDGSYTVTGDLTLLGVTRQIEARAELIGQGKNPRSGKEMIGFETMFEIDRTDYGMDFMAGPLSESVGFLLSLEAGKAGE